MTRFIAGAVVGVAGLLLAGCTATPNPGVLDRPDEHTRWCGLADEYRVSAFGMMLDFTGGDSITITDVTAEDAQGVKVEAPVLMPVDPHWRLAFQTYPPAEDFPEEWPKAVPAIGATVAPGEHVDLVVKVSLTGDSPEGSFDDLVVQYEQSGARHEARAHTALLLSSIPCEEIQ